MRHLLAAALALAVAPLGAVELRVIDGDTFQWRAERVRLANIDAPERGQACTDGAGRAYDCGAAAAAALAALLTGPVTCREDDRDRWGRMVAHCTAGGADLGRAMVLAGHAVAYRRFSEEYADAEFDAAKAGRGLWSGGFDLPSAHRAALAPPPTSPPGDCRIKGNVSRSGARIYHLPGMPSYPATRISEESGERWFCTEAEARAAGWRAPR